MRIQLSKKCLGFVLATMFCACPSNATPHVPDKGNGEDVKFEKKYPFMPREDEKEQGAYSIEAYYDRTREEVTFDLYNIGTATLYIIDSRGEIVDETTVETDVPTQAYLSTALARRGEFMVAVCSEYIYAEGYIKF